MELGNTIMIVALIAIVLGGASLGYTLMTLNELNNKISSLESTLDAVGEATGANILVEAGKEGSILWYSVQPTEHGEHFVELFSEVYPAIDAGYWRGGSYAVLEKVTAEIDAGNVVCDVFSVADVAAFIDLANQGKLLAYESPEYAYYPEGFKDPDGYWCINYEYILCIVYNTNFIAEGEIQSYEDLLDPKYQGQILMEDPRESGTQYYLYYGLYNLLGASFWQGIAAQDPIIVTGWTDACEKVVAGEGWIALGIGHYKVPIYKADGAPLEGVWPKEGIVAVPVPVGILADAPHPNAAKIFVDWMLGPNYQSINRELFYRTSSRSGIPGPLGLPSAAELNILELDWADLAAQRDALFEEWAGWIGG